MGRRQTDIDLIAALEEALRLQQRRIEELEKRLRDTIDAEPRPSRLLVRELVLALVSKYGGLRKASRAVEEQPGNLSNMREGKRNISWAKYRAMEKHL